MKTRIADWLDAAIRLTVCGGLGLGAVAGASLAALSAVPPAATAQTLSPARAEVLCAICWSRTAAPVTVCV